MRLAEALRVINDAKHIVEQVDPVFLACGFTPLHLQTYLTAFLQQRTPSRRAVCETGVFGDVIGNIRRAADRDIRTLAIVVEWSDLDPRLGLRSSGGWSPRLYDQILQTAQSTLTRLDEAIRGASTNSLIALLLPTLPLPPFAHTPEWESSSIELALRAEVASTAMGLGTTVQVVSAQRLDRISPLDARADASSELTTGFPYTMPHAIHVARLVAEVLRPPQPMKGLIVDLDDTLWRGILGEVGTQGVSWSLEDRSQVHGLLQQFLASLAEAGVLIGVSSKNDPALVADALERPDMILKTNQVYPVIANWRAKSEAVGTILSTWNVGADSVIFLDDSPMELAEVAAQHPAIHGVLFPKNDPQAVLDLLRRLRDLFGKRVLTSDDGLRLESIRTGSVARVAAVSGVDGGEEFLAHAEAIVTADFHKSVLNTRAFELLNKTNQFNLNGRRLTDTEWRSLLQDNDSFVLALSYQDRYGPLGTIAVVAGQVVDSGLVIRHWVMSCRAFARRIEHQTLRILFEKFDATQVLLDFHQTERNGPTREFLCEFFDEETGPPPLTLSRRRFDERCRPMYHTVHEPASRQ